MKSHPQIVGPWGYGEMVESRLGTLDRWRLVALRGGGFWIVPGGALFLVGAAVLLHRQGEPSLAAAAGFVGLLLPWLAGCFEMRARFVLRQNGWRTVLAAVFSALIVFHAGLFLLCSQRLGTWVLHPGMVDSTVFWLSQGLVFFPWALVEEFFFRGYLQETALPRILVRLFPTRKGDGRSWRIARSLAGLVTLKNLIAAMVFAGFHSIYWGSASFWLPLAGGLVLGRVMERSRGSLWPAVALHTAGNTTLAWFYLLVQMNLPVSLAP